MKVALSFETCRRGRVCNRVGKFMVSILALRRILGRTFDSVELHASAASSLECPSPDLPTRPLARKVTNRAWRADGAEQKRRRDRRGRDRLQLRHSGRDHLPLRRSGRDWRRRDRPSNRQLQLRRSRRDLLGQ